MGLLRDIRKVPRCNEGRRYLYMVTSPSGKVYIGQTRDLGKRVLAHKYSAKRPSTIFSKALSKYGPESFEWSILGCTSSEIIDDMERYFIFLWSSNMRDFGYNQDSGGSGADRPEGWRERLSSAWTPEKRATLSAQRRGSANPAYGRPTGRERKIRCLEDGKVFDSITRAARFYGLGVGNVQSVCRGRLKTSGGRHFEYVEAA